ncbi:MAG: phosphotransferase [Candidatus Cloacimonadaceae bacterium]|nr:phosphotransferase [Candidatus Cloacimonadaceae bacterium]
MSPKASSVRFVEDTVIKSFDEADLFFRELAVYNANLPMTPKLLSHRETRELVLERIDGIPYLDIPQGFDPIRLAQRIAAFHRHSLKGESCLCHIDNQPKNILWDHADFFLIDFSDSRIEAPEYDLSHLMLFWADSFAPQRLQNLAELFLNEYRKLIPPDPIRWQRCLAENILRFDQRRALFNKKPAILPANQIKQNRLILSSLIV